MSDIILTNEATPSTPATGKTTIFVNSSKVISWIDDTGLVSTPAGSIVKYTNALAADVNLNNTANFFDGPSVAQGTSGTWFASGSIVVHNPLTTGVYSVYIKLWDGTTVIASSVLIGQTSAAGNWVAGHLSGYLSSPAGNIRISVKDTTSTSSVMTYNASSSGKDCIITALKIA